MAYTRISNFVGTKYPHPVKCKPLDPAAWVMGIGAVDSLADEFTVAARNPPRQWLKEIEQSVVVKGGRVQCTRLHGVVFSTL
jgi:hypothetical protein